MSTISCVQLESLCRIHALVAYQEIDRSSCGCRGEETFQVSFHQVPTSTAEAYRSWGVMLRGAGGIVRRWAEGTGRRDLNTQQSSLWPFSEVVSVASDLSNMFDVHTTFGVSLTKGAVCRCLHSGMSSTVLQSTRGLKVGFHSTVA